jgi:hypothetical protein
MEDLVDTITRSNVPQVKKVVTTVITALAVYQVAMMAVGWGKVKMPFLTRAEHSKCGASIARPG